MKLIRFQPAGTPDGMHADGTLRYKLPWPIVVDLDARDDEDEEYFYGKVYGEHMRPRVDLVIGFQKDLAKHTIDLSWQEAKKDPHAAVGMYIVTADTDFKWGVHETAIESIEVFE